MTSPPPPTGPSRQLVIFLPNVNPPGPLPRVAAGTESERGRDVGETARCAPAVEEETSCCASATARCAPAVEEETSSCASETARCAPAVEEETSCCEVAKGHGTLRCVGRPVASAARPAVPSGELQPAVDAERRGHRVHPPRCLSLPLSNTLGFLSGEEALGHQVGPTKANLFISDLFSRLSNEIC
jgi:hypothetical protein